MTFPNCVRMDNDGVLEGLIGRFGRLCLLHHTPREAVLPPERPGGHLIRALPARRDKREGPRFYGPSATTPRWRLGFGLASQLVPQGCGRHVLCDGVAWHANCPTCSPERCSADCMRRVGRQARLEDRCFNAASGSRGFSAVREVRALAHAQDVVGSGVGERVVRLMARAGSVGPRRCFVSRQSGCPGRSGAPGDRQNPPAIMSAAACEIWPIFSTYGHVEMKVLWCGRRVWDAADRGLARSWGPAWRQGRR